MKPGPAVPGSHVDEAMKLLVDNASVQSAADGNAAAGRGRRG